MICIGTNLGAPLAGGCERGGADCVSPAARGVGSRTPPPPRPRPLPRARELALRARPAASGGRRGRCSPAALEGRPRRAQLPPPAATVRRVERGAKRGTASRSRGAGGWARRAPREFGLSCPEGSPPRRGRRERRRARTPRTLQTCAPEAAAAWSARPAAWWFHGRPRRS